MRDLRFRTDDGLVEFMDCWGTHEYLLGSFNIFKEVTHYNND